MVFGDCRGYVKRPTGCTWSTVHANSPLSPLGEGVARSSCNRCFKNDDICIRYEGTSTYDSRKMEALAEFIRKANDAYYNTSAPLCSDAEYDAAVERLRRACPSHAVLREVGAAVTSGREKIRLPYYMGSMDKIKGPKQCERWLSRYASGTFVVSHKLDGVSLLAVRRGGTWRLYTRGNGSVGQDVSRLLKVCGLGLPTKEVPEGMVVRGECIVSKEDWVRCRPSVDAEVRNVVSGCLNAKTHDAAKYADVLRHVRFVAYERVDRRDGVPSEQLSELKRRGFVVVPYRTVSHETVTEAWLRKEIVAVGECAPYDVDGIIVSHNAPYPLTTTGNPKHSVAYKDIDYERRTTIVEEVLWSASQWGRLIPRVRIRPVHLGVRIEYVTGLHAQFVVQNRLGPGRKVDVIRSGLVIPKIVKVYGEGDASAQLPSVSSDEYEWDETGVHFVLKDGNREVAVKRMLRFVKGLGVENVKCATLRGMYDGGIRSAHGLLSASVEDVEKCEGMGHKRSAECVRQLRERYVACSVAECMDASGCFGLGFSVKRLEWLLEAYPGCADASRPLPTKEALEKVKGFGAKTASACVEGLASFRRFASSAPIQRVFVPERKESSSVTGNVVFSGVRDASLSETLAERYGWSTSDAVNDRTVAVIVKSSSSSSRKVREAKKRGVRVVVHGECATVFAGTYTRLEEAWRVRCGVR